MKGRTAIVVAHRCLLFNADNIAVLDRGEVKEQRTLENLLSIGGYYSKLHEMQFQEFIL